MRRWIAIAWHASFLVLAAALYVLFVLPRWFELTGAWPVGLGQPLRIVDGVLIGLAALPVAFTYLHTRKPEFGTPQLALTLRLWSIVAHVAAGVLIVGAAVAEFWVSLDRGGQWLFGVYGAAGALTVLGALGFYLAYLAELPPPPPKPLKPKANRRGRSVADEDEVEDATEADQDTITAEPDTDKPSSDEPSSDETAPDESTVEATGTSDEAEDEPPVFVSSVDETAIDGDSEEGSTASASDDADADDDSDGKLRNRRPAAKSGTRRFLRRRGGVAVDE